MPMPVKGEDYIVPPISNPVSSGSGSGSGILPSGSGDSGDSFDINDLYDRLNSLVPGLGDMLRTGNNAKAWNNVDPLDFAALMQVNPSLAQSIGSAMNGTGSISNAFSINTSSNEGLAALGALISNAEKEGIASTNALNKYMWEQGEANTDRRLQQQMQFTAKQAQNAMDYQERMSNSIHQREVADLKAAGLNPVLSANNGTSTPSGLMGGASAVGSNSFRAAQPNIVGAYSAAGEFVASMLSLQENMRQFDKSFGANILGTLLGSVTGLAGKALGAPRSYSSSYSTNYNYSSNYNYRYGGRNYY